jgi:hypothetical protein
MASEFSPRTISVVRAGPYWRVIYDGQVRCRHSYRVDAEEAALRLARELGGRGQAADVLVQEPYGEMLPLALA